jgi:hypothetical protein
MKASVLEKMIKKSSFLTFGLGITILLNACTFPEVPGQVLIPKTPEVYHTVSAGLTLTPQLPGIGPTSTIALAWPVATDLPLLRTEAPPLQTITPTRTRVAKPCNLAAPNLPNVDITVPDGSFFKSGEAFAKTWRLLNAGSCPWTKDYAIVWFSGENFSAAREQYLPREVQPGETVDITVDMLAPRLAGNHQSNWKLRDASGSLFGIGPAGDAPFWVRIEVGETATITVTVQPSATITPTLSVASRGSVELHTGQSINLDSGKVGTGSGDDVSFQKLDASTWQLTSVNGAVLSDYGQAAPASQDCRNPNLVNTIFKGAALRVGEFLCVRTTQGLPGFIHIKQLALKSDLIEIDYQVWAIP